jgi:hypothetical protein
VCHKTDKGNSGYYGNLFHNSGSWQSQRIDLVKSTLDQLGRQETDLEDDVTTTSARGFGRLLFGETSKSEPASNTTRVFHGIYATTTS